MLKDGRVPSEQLLQEELEHAWHADDEHDRSRVAS